MIAVSSVEDDRVHRNDLNFTEYRVSEISLSTTNNNKNNNNRTG